MARKADKHVPVSSHPEADPEAHVPPDAAGIQFVQDDLETPEPRERRRKPIVSINGTDVNLEDRHGKRAA